MPEIKIGATVKLPAPYAGVPGTVIFYDATKNQYLVRIGVSQQLYFQAADLTAWDAE